MWSQFYKSLIKHMKRGLFTLNERWDLVILSEQNVSFIRRIGRGSNDNALLRVSPLSHSCTCTYMCCRMQLPDHEDISMPNAYIKILDKTNMAGIDAVCINISKRVIKICKYSVLNILKHGHMTCAT